MPIERTLSILKPDATRRNLTGAINQKIEASGLRIVAQKRVRMTLAEAEILYAGHRGDSFFPHLVAYMASGAVVVQVLEGHDAIVRYRELMGADDPETPGTIRQQFALSLGENSVHGSDSAEAAANEIAQWFSGNEIVG
jgi:nucleoside-diphosphate kinase